VKIEAMTITYLPPFVEGMQYRQQHPTQEAGRRWRFVFLKDVLLTPDGISERLGCTRATFYDAKGQQWMKIDKYGILIRAGYAWNGCSPKRWVPIFGWVGTPDFPSTILASGFHDSLYQFAMTKHFPFTRAEVDALFYHTIHMSGGRCIAGTYHGAVQKFASWKDRPKNGEYSKTSMLP
jgi:hypothetical protein